VRIVDRRLNGKNKSVVNRQKFLRRYKKQIRKAVADAISSKDRSIEDIGKGGEISIPVDNTAEPVFRHGSGGINERIQSGNKEFIPGDTIKRPQSDQSGSSASDSGEGVDDFVFQLNKEEFLNFFFEDLQLPNLVKTKLSSIDEYTLMHAGHTSSGIPPNINILRSTKGALSRRIALRNPLKKQLKKLQQELQLAEEKKQHKKCLLLQAEIKQLKKRITAIPFIDDFDLRYNSFTRQPKPVTQAVMFCIMDISASMDRNRKDIAKRFFMLLYLFLTKTYKRIQLVFISHHTRAKEVTEEEFFYSKETGGTVVSTALELMRDITQERYPLGDWNVFAAQASDGDDWDIDPIKCKDILMRDIMPKVQYFAYIEITNNPSQDLWYEYQHVKRAYEFFAMKKIQQLSDIYPVFRELFAKTET
jgi:uncharacterized protein